ncbi:MAG: cytochrome P450, partial [Myxococcales bacterium]|nr:cytochrome P450 [Myxococcales bacterium]
SAAPAPLPDPPGPAPSEAAPTPEQAENPLALLMALGERYGELVRVPSPYGQSYLYNHPSFVRHFFHSHNYERTKLLKIALGDGTLSSDGAVWREQRRIVQPAFQPDKVRGFGALMVDEARAAADRWSAAGAANVDLDEEMMRLTLLIAVRALFSADVSEDVEEISQALTLVIRDLGILTSTLFAVPVSFDPQRNRRLRQALGALDAVVFRIIEARRKAPGSRGDLLDMLLLARDPETGAALDDKRLRDEVVTMLVAGHETTATSLSWAWALLALHPAQEARFHAELATLEGRPPSVDDLPDLVYTRGVLQESMRLYPPVWTIARRVKEDEVLGGYRVRGDSAAFVCPFMLHRHPGFWPEPERFDPTRFDEVRGPTIDRYAYVPFARGPHMCAGHHFATQEGTLILAALGQRFSFQLMQDALPEPWPLVTLRMKGGLPMRLQPRATAATRSP